MAEMTVNPTELLEKIKSEVRAAAEEKLALTLDEDPLENVILSIALYAGTRAILQDSNAASEVAQLKRQRNNRKLNIFISQLPILPILLSMLDSIDEETSQEQRPLAREKSIREAFEMAVKDGAYLSDAESSRIFELTRTLANLIGNRNTSSEIDTGVLALTLDSKSIERFFDDAAVRRDLAQPVPILLGVPSVSLSSVTSSQSPLAPIGARLLDSAHFAKAVAIFDQLGNSFAADTARVFYYLSRRIAAGLSHQRLAAEEFEDLDAFFQKYDHYSAEQFAVFGESLPLILQNKFLLRTSIARDPGLSNAARLRYLESARRDLQQLEEAAAKSEMGPLFQGMLMAGPGLLWQQATLEEEPRRAMLQLKAVEEVQQLLVKAVLQPSAIARISSGVMLTNILASWKYDQGDFAHAMELATMAKSLGEGFDQALATDFEGLQESPDDDDPTRTIVQTSLLSCRLFWRLRSPSRSRVLGCLS